MSKKLKMTALLAVLIVILVLAIGLVACDPKTNTYKVTTQFNAEQGDVTLAPEAKDGIYDEGTLITVSVSAKSGYEFDALTVNTDENAALNNEGKYIFKVTADTQITVLFRSVAPAACEHKNLSALVAGKAATCMEAGVIAHYHCNDCGKDLAEDKTTVLDSTEIAINPNAHDFDVWVAEVPATCSATGTAAHKDCKLCHKHFDSDGKEIAANKYALAIDSTAHNFGTLINGTPATCSAKGEKAHYHCSLCNKDIAEDKATILDSIEINIDPTAHKYGEMQQQKDATCAVAGTKAHKDCELCHKHFSEQNVEIPDNELTIPATGKHTYDKLVNGGEQGHEVHCSVCDAKQSETLTPHTYGTEYVQDGVQGHHQECACGYKTKTQAHEKGNNPYTDYEGETHSFECEKCGRKVTDEHTMGAWQDDGEGKHYKACVCGKETEHGEHNYGDAPVYTDAKDGQHHTVVCTVCQVTVTQKHTTRLASDEESGHHTECTLCDYKTQTVEHKLGEYLNGVGVPGGGTGGVQNYHYKKCSECSYETSQEGCKYEDSAWQMTDKECWKECSVCGQTCTTTPSFVKKQHNKVLKHTSVITEKQQHWEQCDRCGKIYGDKVDCAYEETYAPSKGNPSSYHEYYCTTGQHEVLRKNHELDDAKTSHWVPKPDDEANKHVKGFTCTVCGYVLLDPKSSEEAGHSFGNVLTDDQGLTYQQCSDCKYETEHKKAHTHKWTVTEEGWYEGDGICEGGDGCTESVYKFDEKTGTISAYIGEAKKIKLPDSINGHQVVKLANQNSTSPYIAGFATVEYIQIPNTVTEIDAQTFLESGLIEVTIPNSVNTIGATLFKDSTKLQSVVMGSGISELKATFSGCTALKNILFLYEGIPSVNAASFKNCNALENVYIRANKEAFEAAKTATTFPAADKLSNSNLYSDGVIKLYYDTNPYEGGIDLSGYGAWHFGTSSKQELANILIWDKH